MSACFTASKCNFHFNNGLCRNCPQVGVYDQDEPFQMIEINSKFFNMKTSYHILFHVLGRYHEHQRPDRDQYVMINWNNIKEGNIQ